MFHPETQQPCSPSTAVPATRMCSQVTQSIAWIILILTLTRYNFKKIRASYLRLVPDQDTSFLLLIKRSIAKRTSCSLLFLIPFTQVLLAMVDFCAADCAAAKFRSPAPPCLNHAIEPARSFCPHLIGWITVRAAPPH